jgi:peptidoglycan/xylan/chitin deacetylase (PgdA/CDA1 family)
VITIDTEFPDQPAQDPPTALREQLETLARRNLRATFFIQGAWARAHPEQAKAIGAAGHHIGNHSHSHCSLSRMTKAGIVEDLGLCRDVLLSLGTETRPWFRAPYGKLGDQQLDAVRRAGYRHIDWHADSEDWRPDARAEAVARRTVEAVRARWPSPAIVLLHSWPDATASALGLLVEALEPEGASFLTVDQLIWHERAQATGPAPDAARTPAAGRPW